MPESDALSVGSNQTQSKHWFTTSLLWRKVPESDARSVKATSHPNMDVNMGRARHLLPHSARTGYDASEWAVPALYLRAAVQPAVRRCQRPPKVLGARPNKTVEAK